MDFAGDVTRLFWETGSERRCCAPDWTAVHAIAQNKSVLKGVFIAFIHEADNLFRENLAQVQLLPGDEIINVPVAGSVSPPTEVGPTRSRKSVELEPVEIAET